MLSTLFLRLFLAGLVELHDAGRFRFCNTGGELSDRRAFLRHLAPLRRKKWVVYAKHRPTGQPRPGQGSARRPTGGRGRNSSPIARPSTAVPVLRSPHDGHRHHPERGSAVGAARFSRPIRDDGVVTRPDLLQLPADDTPLRPPAGRTPRPTGGSILLLMAAMLAYSPPRSVPADVFAPPPGPATGQLAPMAE